MLESFYTSKAHLAETAPRRVFAFCTDVRQLCPLLPLAKLAVSAPQRSARPPKGVTLQEAAGDCFSPAEMGSRNKQG